MKSTLLCSLLFLVILGLLISCEQRDTPEDQVRRVVEQWFTALKNGQSGSSFWKDPSLEESFYSVRGWKILDVETHPSFEVPTLAYVTVRVESSNGGGSPIITDWVVSLGKINVEWRINYFTRK